MLRGMIDNGKLVLDDGTKLPDGTRVDVHVDNRRRKKNTREVTLATLLRHSTKTGIPDLADEHDHYVYGTPKRRSGTKSRATPQRKGRKA